MKSYQVTRRGVTLVCAVLLMCGGLTFAPTSAQAGDGSLGLSLPWAAGESGWFSSQGTHNWNGTGPTPSSSLDFVKTNGTVRAAAPGTVRFQPCRNGSLLMIDHGNGWYTSYYH